METACFITTSRADLIDLTQRLVSALQSPLLSPVLTRADRPLLISLTGTFQSGKSLIVDTACAHLFSGQKLVDQDSAFTRWHGLLKQAPALPVEIMHMDVPGGNPYVYQNLKGRAQGGIDFIQNAPALNNEADIALCLEHLGGSSGRYPRTQQKSFQPMITPLRQAGLLSDSWVRFVSVRVNDRRLLQAPPFREAFTALAPQAGFIAGNPLWLNTGDRASDIKRAFRNLTCAFRAATQPLAAALPGRVLPVYGQNFPHFLPSR